MTTLAQASVQIVCAYEDMQAAILEASKPAELLSASHAFLVGPKGGPNAWDFSEAVVSVFIVFRGLPEVIAAIQERPARSLAL